AVVSCPINITAFAYGISTNIGHNAICVCCAGRKSLEDDVPFRAVQEVGEGQNGGSSPTRFTQRMKDAILAQLPQNWQGSLLGDARALDKITGLKNRSVE